MWVYAELPMRYTYGEVERGKVWVYARLPMHSLYGEGERGEVFLLEIVCKLPMRYTYGEVERGKDNVRVSKRWNETEFRMGVRTLL